MSEILVLGGSVAGLSVAMMLSRAGHRVTVLERDGRPAPADPFEAATRHRPTVPQAQQAHGLQAAGRQVLRRQLPDVLAELRRHGANEFPLARWTPSTAVGLTRSTRD